MRAWQWVALAVAVVVVAALVYPLVETRRQLKAVGSELVRAEEQVVRARAGTAKLENVVASLKTELDAANKKRTELQENLDESNSDNEQLRKELDSAQAQLIEKQAYGKELMG
jgi:septal ring factor EnvC (AmiA/AmiB activator)